MYPREGAPCATSLNRLANRTSATAAALQGGGQLYINGELVGNTEFPTTVPLTFGIEGLSCGYDFGEAVSHEYKAPFAFTGGIKHVTIDMSGELIEDDEARVRMLMAPAVKSHK